MNYLNIQKALDELLSIPLSEGELKLASSIASILKVLDQDQVAKALAYCIVVRAVDKQESALKD